IAGDGGMVMITTGTGTLFTPKGTIGVQGGDGGMWQAHTGNGGNTTSGQAGSSGDIGAGSVPGDGGSISLTSSTPPPGDTSTSRIEYDGLLGAQGGNASGNLCITGDGGISLKGG